MFLFSLSGYIYKKDIIDISTSAATKIVMKYMPRTEYLHAIKMMRTHFEVTKTKFNFAPLQPSIAIEPNHHRQPAATDSNNVKRLAAKPTATQEPIQVISSTITRSVSRQGSTARIERKP